jgi:hypothetical protein
MKLNNRIRGLPKWPRIELNKATNEVLVSAKHISYKRFTACRIISRSFSFFVIGAILIYAYHVGHENDAGKGFLAFLALILPASVLSLLPWAKILSGLIFPRKTVVRFTDNAVIVNGKKFDTSPGIGVNFRMESYIAPEELERFREKNRGRRVSSNKLYQLSFYRIEMIYGSRAVTITSLSGTKKLEQFVVALQAAFEMSRKPEGANVASPARQFRPGDYGDVLPE